METGKEKIQKICDSLRRETIEPAKQAAVQIVENAHLQAAEIVETAQKKAEELIQKGEKELEQKKRIFESTMLLAGNKTVADLKQKIEAQLFNQKLKELLVSATNDPKIIAELIRAVLEAIEKEGLEGEVSAYISKRMNAKEVAAYLLQDILSKLKEKELLIGDFDGGAKLKLHEQGLTIDLSATVLQEKVASFVREDFRKTLFNL